MAETLSIGLQLRLDEFLTEIKKIPDISAQEARDMASGMRRELRAIDKAAQNTANELRKAAKAGGDIPKAITPATGALDRFTAAAKGLNSSPIISNLESMGALFIGVGGNVSRVAMTFTTAVRPVATLGTLFSALPAGVQQTAIQFGVAGVAAAGLALAFSSAVTRARETADAMAEVSIALHEQAAAGDVAARVLLATYAPALEAVAAREVLLKRDTDAANVRLLRQGPNAVAAAAGWDRLSYAAGVGFSEAWKEFTTLPGLETVLVRMGQQALNDEIAFGGMRRALEDLNTEIGKTDAAKIQTAFNASKMRGGSASYDIAADLRATVTAWNAAEEAATRAGVAAREARGGLDAFGGGFVEASEAITAHFTRTVPRARAEIEGFGKAANEVGIELTDSSKVWANASREELDALGAYAVGVVTDVSAGITAITDLIIGNYERRVAAGEKLSVAEMRNANRLDALAKTAAISAMSVSALVTYFALVRDLALIPGNAPFAIAEAATIVAASMIAPAVQVLGQPVPFPYAQRNDNGGHAQSFDANGDGVLQPGERQQAYANAYGSGNLGSGGGADRSARTHVTIGLDPSLRSLSITSDVRVGKSPRRAGGL